PSPLYPFYAHAPKDILPDLKFLKGFKFGVAISAYQVKGAIKNEEWASRRPNVNGVFDNPTGDHATEIIAADVAGFQYFLHKEDVGRSTALGVTVHSF
ncbi:hypothetical protein ARMSODRAFT_857354, partial [Armillaria solidipes]